MSELSVRHKRYGWAGTVAPYGHAEGRYMIIWEHGSNRGASLADGRDLLFTVQTTLGLWLRAP